MSPGLIVLFGSGEMSPTGRKIHEDVFTLAGFHSPVKIGILETPTGYEVNAIHGWPERMQNFFENGLKNFKPSVTRIRAWRRDGAQSTNNPKVVDAILHQDYLYCGAGSPVYTVYHLKGTKAFDNIINAQRQGCVLCFGSAAAIAMSALTLPVYEIFKTGADLHWIEGLNFFAHFGLNLTIIPHWNNQEGQDFDTTRCWMGKERFAKLVRMLPKSTTILGIDEQTGCLLHVATGRVDVVGIGAAYIVRGKSIKAYPKGSTFTLKRIAT